MKAPQVQLFDANFEGLLREAAAAPRSMLLRVERPQVFPALRSREAPASVAMAGLSSVERELLASYRAELGFLLRQAALTQLMRDDATSPWIDSTITEEEVHRLPSKAAWKERVAGCMSPSDPERGDEVTRAIRCLMGLITGRSTHPSTPELAAAAMRINPVDQPRVYAGAHYTALGECSSSIEVLRSVLDGTSNAGNEVFAREWIALALARMHRLTEATNCMKAAVMLGFPRPELSMRYLLYAALSGDITAVSDAMLAVAAEVQEDHPAVKQVCRGIRKQVRQGVLRPNSTTQQVIDSVGPRTGIVATRILNELTS